MIFYGYKRDLIFFEQIVGLVLMHVKFEDVLLGEQARVDVSCCFEHL